MQGRVHTTCAARGLLIFPKNNFAMNQVPKDLNGEHVPIYIAPPVKEKYILNQMIQDKSSLRSLYQQFSITDHLRNVVHPWLSGVTEFDNELCNELSELSNANLIQVYKLVYTQYSEFRRSMCSHFLNLEVQYTFQSILQRVEHMHKIMSARRLTSADCLLVQEFENECVKNFSK